MTRDLSLVGSRELGYNPVKCNWDAWAGHWKPKCVGRPVTLSAKSLSSKITSWIEEPTKAIELRQPKLTKILENGNKPQVHPV